MQSLIIPSFHAVMLMFLRVHVCVRFLSLCSTLKGTLQYITINIQTAGYYLKGVVHFPSGISQYVRRDNLNKTLGHLVQLCIRQFHKSGLICAYIFYKYSCPNIKCTIQQLTEITVYFFAATYHVFSILKYDNYCETDNQMFKIYKTCIQNASIG